jgi:hypothetical protein
MPTFKVFKETALPGTPEANSVYFITNPSYPDLVEVVVTNTGATAPHRHVLNRADVQTMIDNSLSSLNEIQIVANIAARNALNPTSPIYVYVVNATGDATVQSGGATYLYNPGTTSWIKTSEAESMDVSVTWASITGKPASSAAAIDGAVANSHTHANLTQLNLIGQNGASELTYNGVQVKTEWSTTGW